MLKTLTPEILNQLYCEEGLSTVQIGKRFATSSETIRRRLKKWGIRPRTLSEAAQGEKNSQYLHGEKVGPYVRKGYNPWNRGKTKKTDPLVAEVAERIKEAISGHPSLFKPVAERTYEDCVETTTRIASGLRSREESTYGPYINLLPEGWVPEHFEESFVFQGEGGLWHGFIVDLAHPSLKLCIEIDGGYHDFPCQGPPDQERDARLRRLGWKVYRVKAPEDLADLSALWMARLGPSR